MTSSAAPKLTPVSPVACDSVLCRQGGVLWVTVVVKATFELTHGKPARLGAPAPILRRDRPAAPGASLAEARETAPHVPGAGVLLTGHACAPHGRPVPSMSVRLGISRERPVIDKTVHVFGARSVSAPSVVAPFQKMPLVYERAFGGAGVWENPVGTGGPGSTALPNLVDPRDPRRVAGFGPVAGHWAPRRAMAGGADAALLEQPIFEPPPGFDWRYFQAAPADQQLDGLRGDEWIVLDGMHAALPRIQTRLPQAAAEARRLTSGKAPEPVPLRADMLVIDADRLVASLVWRGRFPVESTAAIALLEVQAGVALPGQPIAWPTATAPQIGDGAAATTETRDVDVAAILGAAVPFDPGRAGALPSAPGAAPSAPSSFMGTAMVDLAKVLQGKVPFRETSPAAATAELSALVPMKDIGASRSLPIATIAEMPALAAPSMPFAPAALDRPPVESIASGNANKAKGMSTGTTDIDLAQILGAAAPFPLGATRADAAAAPAPTEPATAVTAPSPIPPPAVTAVPVPIAQPPPNAVASSALPGGISTANADRAGVRAAVLERLEKRKPLHDLKLSTADLRDIDFKETSLAGLDLHRASLQNAKLGRACLAGARLPGADLTGADLSAADLSKADLRRACLEGACLAGAVLTGAQLVDARAKGARFDRARMEEADLSGADLPEASFNDADAPASLWDRATLTGATFLGAKLRGASFSRSTLEKACFSEADLRLACLQRASGEDVDLRVSRLEAADLRQAALPGATFDDADLRDVSATKADFSGARFFRADLGSANLRAARLDGADFTHARLDGADLRDAEIKDIKIDPAAARVAKIRLPR